MEKICKNCKHWLPYLYKETQTGNCEYWRDKIMEAMPKTFYPFVSLNLESNFHCKHWEKKENRDYLEKAVDALARDMVELSEWYEVLEDYFKKALSDFRDKVKKK